MSRTSAPATPKICPTSVHRPESTLHPPGRRKRFRPAGFPLTESTGRFRLVADESRPRPETPATDPIDPDRLLEPILNRSFRASNVLAGISFRHATWHRDRARVQEALDPTDPDPHAWIRYEHDPDWEGLDPLPFPSDRARRFRQCGERSVVLQHADDPSRYKVACQRCHDRFCLPCMQDRARLIVANLRAQVKYEPTRFLTLTLKHNDAPSQSNSTDCTPPSYVSAGVPSGATSLPAASLFSRLNSVLRTIVGILTSTSCFAASTFHTNSFPTPGYRSPAIHTS